MPASQEYDKIVVEDAADGRARRIALDNLEMNNVLTYAMLQELHDALERADRNDDIQGIILGTTGDVFCSGANVDELKGLSAVEGVRWLNKYWDVLELMKDTGKPTIAAVVGPCVAGGNEVSMACDLVIASEESVFGQPEVGIGSTAGGGGLQMLPLMVGERRAKELILTADLLSAPEAEDIGLINRAVAPDDVEDEAIEVLVDIVENSSPQAYRVMKSVMKQWSNLGMLAWESQRELTAQIWATEEFDERATAFLNKDEMEKRPFTGVRPRDEL